MAKTLQAVQGRLAAIEGKPALGLTPQLFRQVIEDAGQRGCERAGRAMADGAAGGRWRTARRRRAPRRASRRPWSAARTRARTSGSGSAWLQRAVSCSAWCWCTCWPGYCPGGGGDWLAASLVGGGPWQAGQRLMQDADPESFDKMVKLYNVCGARPVEFCTAAIAVELAAKAGKGSGAEPTRSEPAAGTSARR